MKDSISTNEKEVRGSTLMSDYLSTELEEAHYYHTINAFVELIVLYGWDTVMGDLKTTMREKQW